MNTKRMLLIVGAVGLFAGSLSAQVATVEGRLSGIDSRKDSCQNRRNAELCM